MIVIKRGNMMSLFECDAALSVRVMEPLVEIFLVYRMCNSLLDGCAGTSSGDVLVACLCLLFLY